MQIQTNRDSRGSNSAKRYERMMKQHGLHQGASASRDPPSSPVTTKEAKPTKASSTKASSTKASPANKKRKATAMDDATELGQDDHEGLSRHVKTEGDAIVKDEPDDTVNPQTLPTTAADKRMRTEEGAAVPSDDRLFHDYLHSSIGASHGGSSANTGYDGAYDLTTYRDPGAMDPGSIFID